MSTIQQIEQNLALANQAHAGKLTAADLARVDEVRTAYREACLVACTNCQYCQPCPQEINIPLMFEFYNTGYMYETLEESRWFYEHWIRPEKRADHCLKCQECESKCPQHLPICELLEAVDAVLGQGKSYAEVLQR